MNKSLKEDICRILLAASAIIAISFSGLLITYINDIFHIKKIEAKVVDVYEWSYNDSSPARIRNSMEFVIDGKTYQRSAAETEDVRLRIGDTKTITYDDRAPDKYLAETKTRIFLTVFVATVITACIFFVLHNRKYIKGYYKGFLCKHDKASIFTGIDALITALVLLWAKTEANNASHTGFEGLGIALYAMGWTLASSMSIAVVWIISVVKKAKEYNNNR